MTLILPAPLRARAIAAGRAAAPSEACGLIEGVARGSVFSAVALHPCENQAGIGRFAIDPAVHIGLRRRLRGGPSAVIGCFHSHPNGAAAPSAADRAAGGPPGFVWLIAGGGTGTWNLAAFVAPEFRPLTMAVPA